MKPILYGHLVSPPVRSVMMLIRQLNLDVEFKTVNLFKRQNWEPDFLKMNPMHTVPVLKHDDLIVTDSHSILMYLVDKLAPDSNLFPKTNLNKRTEIINKLMFNATFFFPRDSAVFRAIIHHNAKDISEQKEKLWEAYDILEGFLANSKFIAGPTMTIADFSIVATASTVDHLCPITTDKWPRVVEWMTIFKNLSYYEDANQKGLEELKDFLKNFGF